ncbi:hypothetical protein BD770DRAFT_415395 [Pilaira anomala]|nr:hypothetical protein BD770DRAFT_415395 [Pilaira anomala]
MKQEEEDVTIECDFKVCVFCKFIYRKPFLKIFHHPSLNVNPTQLGLCSITSSNKKVSFLKYLAYMYAFKHHAQRYLKVWRMILYNRRINEITMLREVYFRSSYRKHLFHIHGEISVKRSIYTPVIQRTLAITTYICLSSTERFHLSFWSTQKDIVRKETPVVDLQNFICTTHIIVKYHHDISVLIKSEILEGTIKIKCRLVLKISLHHILIECFNCNFFLQPD